MTDQTPAAGVVTTAGEQVVTAGGAPIATVAPASAPEPADAQVAAATKFSPSGAPDQTSGIDPDHPAVDADPRANTTVAQNRIDFNDPHLSGAEAVERNLAAQGFPVAKPQA